jgi:hypothetical protein
MRHIITLVGVVFFSALISSCEKTTAKYDGNYAGTVSMTSITEFFNPPQVIPPISGPGTVGATVYSENDDVLVDCAVMCETVKLKNGKANVSCSTTQTFTGGKTVRTISGQVEVSGSSLYMNIKLTQESFLGTTINSRLTQT